MTTILPIFFVFDGKLADILDLQVLDHFGDATGLFLFGFRGGFLRAAEADHGFHGVEQGRKLPDAAGGKEEEQQEEKEERSLSFLFRFIGLSDADGNLPVIRIGNFGLGFGKREYLLTDGTAQLDAGPDFGVGQVVDGFTVGTCNFHGSPPRKNQLLPSGMQ